jgi:hypothetical protein
MTSWIFIPCSKLASALGTQSPNASVRILLGQNTLGLKPPTNKEDRKNRSTLLAEREGFEPSVPSERHNCFRDSPVQPLLHLSFNNYYNASNLTLATSSRPIDTPKQQVSQLSGQNPANDHFFNLHILGFLKLHVCDTKLLAPDM